MLLRNVDQFAPGRTTVSATPTCCSCSCCCVATAATAVVGVPILLAQATTPEVEPDADPDPDAKVKSFLGFGLVALSLPLAIAVVLGLSLAGFSEVAIPVLALLFGVFMVIGMKVARRPLGVAISSAVLLGFLLAGGAILEIAFVLADSSDSTSSQYWWRTVLVFVAYVALLAGIGWLLGRARRPKTPKAS